MLSKPVMPYVIAFFVGIASLYIVKEVSLARRSAPPPLVTVGPWNLTAHDGKKFGTDELKGKVVIANFFFTRCPTICPKLMNDMREVQKRFVKDAADVHFLSFSVDPEFDTPQILKEYVEKNRLPMSNWTLLTGTHDEIMHVVTNQMKLHMGDKIPLDKEGQEDLLFNISHIQEIVLFDQNGDLRGKFPTDPTGLAQVVRSAKFLIEKGASV